MQLEDAVFFYEYKEMKEEIRKYNKLKDMRNEDCRIEQLYIKAIDGGVP